MPTRASDRLRKIASISPLIDALEDSRAMAPRSLPLEDGREALQALYELGTPPSIDREEPAFAWYWPANNSSHWMVIEQGESEAIGWVAPTQWPLSSWLLEHLAGLRRTEFHVDHCEWVTRSRRAECRRVREQLAQWLASHRRETTHVSVVKGDAQGLFDRVLVEHPAELTLPADVLNQGHWETIEDLPYGSAPYVRGLEQPWAYQVVESWKP